MLIDYFRGYRQPSSFASEYLLYSTQMGHLRTTAPHDLHIERKNVPGNILMYVMDGNLHLQMEHQYTVLKNQAVIFQQKAPHLYYNSEADCELLWIHFNGRESKLFLDYIDDMNGFPLFVKSDKLPALMKSCFPLYLGYDSDREYKISGILYSILMEILYCAGHGRQETGLTGEAAFKNLVMSYVYNHMHQKITLPQFAAEFHLSPSYFNKLFKDAFSQTPMEMVMNEKLEYSKHLLIDTNFSVSQIAVSLTFTDQSHYTNLFRKRYGITPNQYRKLTSADLLA